MLIPSLKTRNYLARPFGPILRGEALKKYLENTRDEVTITIGDVVTKTYLEITGNPPHIAIVDGKTKRGTREEEWLNELKRVYRQNYIVVRNPQGGLLKEELIETMSELELNLLSLEKTLVIIEGEEDLLALLIPLILPQERKYRLIYGQPGQGAVIINVDNDIQSRFLNIISIMDTFIGNYTDIESVIGYSRNDLIENKC